MLTLREAVATVLCLGRSTSSVVTTVGATVSLVFVAVILDLI